MDIKTYTKKDFNWTKWDAKTIRSFVPKIIEHKKKVYSEIKKIPKEKRTFENTVYALEKSDIPYESTGSYISLLSMVSPIDSVREAAKKSEKELSKKLVDVEYDKGIYLALLEYAHGPNRRKEKLFPEDKKLLNDALKGYKRMGFDLPEVKQKILKNLLKELSRISNDFSNTLNEYEDYILVTREELEGLPERYIDGLTKDKRTRKYKVTLQYPDVGPFMAYAKHEARRKELADKNAAKGGRNNLLRAEKALVIREKKARLLGYKNHADYVTEMRMAKNGKNAFSFIASLSKKLDRGFMKDYNALTNLKREMTGDPNATLFYYDVAYYGEKLKQRRYKIDSEKLREYFPFEKVIKGTFEIYQKLLGVKFEKVNGYPVWHEDVEVYAVKEKGKVIAYFMLDLYPRKNKYGHACAVALVDGRLGSFRTGAYVAPVAAMLTNFPKPRPDVPSLLSHGEVETFFHEFGHVMHVVLTKSRYESQSGYHVAWDFVEAPSQMFENWTWNREMLGLLSSHYKTNKPLPINFLKNLLRAKKHLECYGSMYQLAHAHFDLLVHTKKPKESLNRIAKKVMFKHMRVSQSPNSLFPAGFGHFMGYDAGYYSYMWALVYAADMFTRFKKEGLLNPKTGRDYRTWVLEKGSSMEEIDIVKKFLGRAPNNKAFLKEIGVLK
ncbi:MAG: M3 family metallopeptidase [Patescibacteria group bacterium]